MRGSIAETRLSGKPGRGRVDGAWSGDHEPPVRSQKLAEKPGFEPGKELNTP